MKKSVKLGALAATALLAACASSSGGKGPDITADQNDTGYITTRDGGVVTGKFGECFRDGNFKASQAIEACDPDLVPKAPPPPPPRRHRRRPHHLQHRSLSARKSPSQLTPSSVSTVPC